MLVMMMMMNPENDTPKHTPDDHRRFSMNLQIQN